jgi:cytochrome c1
MEERKGLGFSVIIYLAILTLLLYLVKRKIWTKVEH